MCSIWIPASLDEAFRDFPQSLQANARWLYLIRPRLLSSRLSPDRHSIILPLEAITERRKINYKNKGKTDRTNSMEITELQTHGGKHRKSWEDQYIQTGIRARQRDKVLCMMIITTDAQIVTTTKQKQVLNFSTASSVRKIKNSWDNNVHCFRINRLQATNTSPNANATRSLVANQSHDFTTA
jgi:hypothetical protein